MQNGKKLSLKKGTLRTLDTKELDGITGGNGDTNTVLTIIITSAEEPTT